MSNKFLPTFNGSVRRFLAGLLVAVCVGVTGAVITSPGTASAVNPCDGPNPPASCTAPDPRAPADPVGLLEVAVRRPGGILVSGWANDRNRSNAAMTIVVTLGSQQTNVTASLPRSDGAVGFQALVATTLSGNLTVCARAVNIGAGNNDTAIGCRPVAVDHNPTGSLDEVTSGLFSVRVRGWAIDPDTANPITVHVYQDGVFVNAWTADVSRTDVDAAYPGYGALHGFDILVPHPSTNTTHTICVYGINTSTGTVNTQLGCRSWVEIHGPPLPATLDRLSTFQQQVDGVYSANFSFFDESTDESKFDVYVQGGSWAQWTLAASLPGNAVTGQRTFRMPRIVDPETTYCFMVNAYNFWNYSVAQGCFTTPRLPPLAPANLALTATGSNGLNVAWDDRSTDEDAFYVWYWKDRPGVIEDRSAPPRIWSAHPGTGRWISGLSGLDPGTRYCVTIVSARQQLLSLGPRACQSTDALPPPAQPSGLTVTAASQTALDLHWSDNATNETGYRVDRLQGSSWVGVATLGANTGSFRHTGLAPGTTACYQVVAINAGGETPSATACGTTSSPLADLAVLDIEEMDYNDPTVIASLLHGGESFIMAWHLCNLGAADASTHETTLNIWDGQSTVSSTTITVPRLAAGTCMWQSVPFANGLAAGQYDAFAAEDSNGAIAESSEFNNIFKLSFNILKS